MILWPVLLFLFNHLHADLGIRKTDSGMVEKQPRNTLRLNYQCV